MLYKDIKLRKGDVGCSHAYPLAVTKCQVNVLLLTLNVNTDLRSRLSSGFVSGIKTVVLSKLCHRPLTSQYNIRT